MDLLTRAKRRLKGTLLTLIRLIVWVSVALQRTVAQLDYWFLGVDSQTEKLKLCDIVTTSDACGWIQVEKVVTW
jgi:hypothetical protein